MGVSSPRTDKHVNQSLNQLTIVSTGDQQKTITMVLLGLGREDACVVGRSTVVIAKKKS